VIPRTLFRPEHDLFRESVRRFVEAEIVPFHQGWEREGIVPRSLWLKAGASGLLCCNIPEEYGGVGGDFLFSMVVMEELSRVGASGPFFHLHSDIVAPYLLHYGSEQLKQQWLPKMAAGGAIGAIAMSEPSGGSDVQAIRTTAVRAGNDWVLNGQKVFISNGELCDLVVVAAQTSPGSRGKGLGLFLVEATLAGFSRGRRLEKIGLKAQDTAELFFMDVRVPASNLLGAPGEGFAQLMTELAQERLIQAIRAVATSEAAIQWTLDYVTARGAFGHTIWDFQNTQFKLAELTAATTLQRVLVDRLTELHLEGHLDAVDAAIAKLTTTEALGRVVDECLQLFGGWGYVLEYPIARAFIDARQARLSAGSIEVMKQIIARSLVRKTIR
jgi:acyl-CoA dehydrogenase